MTELHRTSLSSVLPLLIPRTGDKPEINVAMVWVAFNPLHLIVEGQVNGNNGSTMDYGNTMDCGNTMDYGNPMDCGNTMDYGNPVDNPLDNGISLHIHTRIINIVPMLLLPMLRTC